MSDALKLKLIRGFAKSLEDSVILVLEPLRDSAAFHGDRETAERIDAVAASHCRIVNILVDILDK
jgi:hypothetical protein